MIKLNVSPSKNIYSQRLSSYEKKVNQKFVNRDGVITLIFSNDEDQDRISVSDGLLEIQDNLRLLWHQTR